MKILLAFVFSVACWGQSISVTAPTAGQAIGGGQSFSTMLSCSVTSISTLARVHYFVDGEPGPWAIATTQSACPSAVWNAYNVGNGAHAFTAVGYDASGAVLATSAAVSANVWNFLPQQTCLFTATPTNACGDITVSALPTTSMAVPSPTSWTLHSLSFKNSGSTPAIVGSPAIASDSPSVTTETTPSHASTIGHYAFVVNVWYVPNAAAPTTVADIDGNDCLLNADTATQDPSNNSFKIQTCWIKMTANHASGYTVTSMFSGAAASALYMFEVQNIAASTPSDVKVSTGATSTTSLISQGLTLAQTGEILFGAATWVGSQVATAATGFTVVQDANHISAVEYILPPASGWYGHESLNVTVNGANNGNAKTFFAFVDGYQWFGIQTVSQTDTATTKTLNLNTTNYPNSTTHQVSIGVFTDANCTGCSTAGVVWTWLGGWEQQATFANGATPMELRLTDRDAPIVCSGSIPSTCSPSTIALSGTDYNTDGTSAGATISTCAASSDATVATIAKVSNTCVWTPVALGSAFTTVTDSLGFTRVNWIYVVAANVTPTFATDATFPTTWDATKSVVMHSAFTSSNGLLPISSSLGSAIPGHSAARFAADYVASGYQAVEFGMQAPPGVNGYPTNQTAWQNQVDAEVAATCAYLTSGLRVYLFADQSWASNPNMWFTTRGTGSAWTPNKALAYVFNSHKSQCNPLGVEMQDEITSQGFQNPLACSGSSGCIVGNNGFTNIVCTADPCVVNWTAWANYLHAFDTGSRFIVTGSTSSNLNYDTSAMNCPQYYTGTTINANSFSFPRPSGVSGTFTSGTDPAMQIQIYGFATFNGSTNVQGNGQSGLGPCAEYTRYNAFPTFKTFVDTVSGHAPFTFAPLGSDVAANPKIMASWTDSTISNYADVYTIGYGSTYYLPTKGVSLNLLSVEGDQFRKVFGSVSQKAILLEGSGVVSAFGYVGYPVALTSCTGAKCISAAHNMPNILAGVTRGRISGSSGGGDGNYYIPSTPTATTITVAYQYPTFNSGCNGFSGPSGSVTGTLTFSDGSTASSVALCADMAGADANNTMAFAPCSATTKGKRGLTFMISGTGVAGFDNNSWIYDAESGDSCTGQDMIHQLAGLSSTGGAIYLIPSNSGIMGPLSWVGNGLVGNLTTFASAPYSMLLGAAGGRDYAMGANNNSWDRTAVQQYPFPSFVINLNKKFNTSGLQQGVNPYWESTGSRTGWWAKEMGNLITNKIAPWCMQPKLASPDYGKFYEAGARQDGSGNNCLMLESFADARTSLTATLTPYLISSKTIAKYVATPESITVSTVAAGTNTDTTTCPAGCFVAYIFDSGGAANVITQPSVTINVAAVPAATGVLVEWCYGTGYCFDPSQGDVQPLVYDCGATLGCSPPWDRGIGPITYRWRYYTTGYALLPTSRPQQL